MKTKILIFIYLLIPAFLLYGCKDEKLYEDKVKIVFELEGGTYQNCTLPIVHYYDKTDSTTLITDPTTLTGAEVTRSGYTLEGWYQKKLENNGTTIYQDRWDFEHNFVDNQGVTLYAFWKKDIKYLYQLCYYNENQEVVELGNYSVNPGDKFKDYANYSYNRLGYTPIEFRDAEGNLWDDNFTHPGGETDLTIQVFVEYIEGEFAIVKNANDLRINKSKNIYLANDIDLEGSAFSFNDYKGIFMGNGFTISNFTINYDPSRNGLIQDFDDPNAKSLAISLFGNVTDATIQDVTFDNVKINIKTSLTITHKIYVAPIAMSSVNSNLKNIVFNGTLTCTALPNGFDKDNNLIIVDAAPIYKQDEQTVLDNNQIDLKIE
ncbi:MAG: InlB B-repeat-containing protein [Christensenellales bacterium]|jgi:lipoprotein|nr:InlB B-repeat-containing protein [Staphylococcus sp.]CDC70604.1 putative uncharacterized protein [Staphylococcus sp. CAG:324]